MLRTDVLDIYIARRATLGLEFLQFRRVQEPLAHTWQPIMGHIEQGEATAKAMWRELWEEAGLLADDQAIIGARAQEQVHPFYIAKQDYIMMSPRFLIEVTPTWKPTLNEEHDQHRWVQEAKIDDMFLWPGQKLALREAASVMRGDATEPLLRVSR
jgi:8-oxo-dGTP pyrophosphatase MutT (NUDIX family)